MNILKRREYKGAVSRFARQYTRDYYALGGDQTMTNADVLRGVQYIAVGYKVDEKVVAADVLDAVNRYMDKYVRLGPGDLKVPRLKTPREFLAEGRPDLVAENYPEGGSVEELLLPSDDEPPEPHTQPPPPPLPPPPRD